VLNLTKMLLRDLQKYLNNNEYDEAGDRDIINMMYNTGWKPLKYNNGKWSK
jgi:hypothetical protein